MRFHQALAHATLLWIATLSAIPSLAQGVPAHAQGLREELIVVSLEQGAKQVGVLSMKIGSDGHTRLAVLLPGYPSVVRPVVENGVMVSSKQTGNFLIRSRRHLVDDDIATLIVDCQSDSGDYCSSAYQASQQRQIHVQKLINEVRKRNPKLEHIWLIGTSMGTVSSSFMPLHDPKSYTGAIHTASITEPYARGSYAELGNFNYRKLNIPQFFIHHRHDPCFLTTYAGAKSISEKYDIPLITVNGGSGFQGDACQALSEHGFRGKEKEVMAAIGQVMRTGKPETLEIP